MGLQIQIDGLLQMKYVIVAPTSVHWETSIFFKYFSIL